MIADRDEGWIEAPSVVARRPKIRPRAVTPPRSAQAASTPTPTPTWRLPPVRVPSPRVRVEDSREAARPALLLVADASDQLEIALRHESREVRPLRSPRTVAVAVAIAVAAAVAVIGALSFAFARPSAPRVAVPAHRATTATATTTAAGTAAAPAAVAAPVIPVVDVNSLPTAR